MGLALALAALAPTGAALAAASLLVGLTATVAQQIVPFAAALAAPEARGRTIGTVMSGVLCGILFSRTLGGFVATHEGWRAMFWLAVPMAWGGAALMALTLPRHHPDHRLRYGEALRSLAHLWRRERTLRTAALTQAALFASFTAFWTILSLHLEEPAYHLGADVAGLFGVVGAVGVVAAPLAGRIADTRGPRLVVGLGALLTVAAWAMFGLWPHMAGLIIGVIILDFGVQSALVSNQHLIFALDARARSRINTLFMGSMFLGGSVGSATATAAWHAGGWMGVSLLGAALAILGLAVEAMSRARGERIPHPAAH